MANRRWWMLSAPSIAAAGFLALAYWATPALADQPFYVQTDLVSNNGVPGTTPDKNLVNSWGIVQPPGGPFWINTNGTGLSELYDGDGNSVKFLPFVTIPPPSGPGPSTPDGIVFNPTSSASMNNFKGDIFIFAAEDGTISGWQFSDGTTAMLRVNNSSSAVYKGLAFGISGGGSPQIYATNFHDNRIDVFDSGYTSVVLPLGAFSDPALPAGYAPFGIANIAGELFVSYALQSGDKHDDVPGPHHGFIDEYNTDGMMVRRFVSGGDLDSPWGMVLAPGNFGRFSGAVLVGNFRNGHINAYDLHDRKHLGELRGEKKAIVIDGLWGLAFGNGSTNFDTPTNILYFAAGPDRESNGLFGKIEVGTDKKKP